MTRIKQHEMSLNKIERTMTVSNPGSFVPFFSLLRMSVRMDVYTFAHSKIIKVHKRLATAVKYVTFSGKIFHSKKNVPNRIFLKKKL